MTFDIFQALIVKKTNRSVPYLIRQICKTNIACCIMTRWKARFQVRRTHRVLIVKIMITNAMQGVVSIRDEMKKDEQGLLSQNCPCLLISKFWASKQRRARRALSRRSLALDLSFSRLDLPERTLTFALRSSCWPAGKRALRSRRSTFQY